MFSAARKIIHKFRNALHKAARAVRFRKLKKAFQGRTFSVFSSNCVGCLMLHDLGVAFRSPFVNLYMNAADYLKYLQDPQKYNEMAFTQLPTEQNYPVGRLGDLTVHFVHYPSFDEAVAAFQRRVPRIRYDRLFVIFSERDGCTYEDLQAFDRLPYKNKIVFTHKPYADIQSSFCIEGFADAGELGDIIKWDKKWGHKPYDQFDFANWFYTHTTTQESQ